MNISASGIYNNVQYIRIKGIRPALVFITGVNSTPDQWTEVVEHLDTNREIWLISPPRYGKYEFQDIVEDVREFFAKHWLLKPYIIGHSLGGLTTLELLRQGQKSRGIMLISAPSFEYTSEAFNRQIRKIHKIMHKSGPYMDRAIELVLQTHPFFRSFMKDASLQSYLDAYIDLIERNIGLKLSEKIIRRVPKRVGIYGMEDMASKISHGYKPEEFKPTKLIEVPGGGHFIQREKPEIIAEAIKENLLKRR